MQKERLGDIHLSQHTQSQKQFQDTHIRDQGYKLHGKEKDKTEDRDQPQGTGQKGGRCLLPNVHMCILNTSYCA